MKIIFPIGAFYPYQGGGPSLSVYWMVKALAREKIDVFVVTTTHGLGNQVIENVWTNLEGVQIQYCSSSWRLIKLTLRLLKSCNVVHLTSFSYWPSAFVACWTSLFSKKKIVWSPRGELADSAINGRKIKRFLFQSYGVLFKNKIVFHGTSEKEIEEIKNVLGRCHTVKFPNYMELPPKLDCPRKHVLIYLGRISPIKSLDKLFEALSLSRSFINSDYKFLVAGKSVKAEEKACEDRLRKQVVDLGLQEKIVFLGAVVGEEKNRLLSEAYFSFLVSESENFGNVVVEAMVQGTPVVASTGTPWSVLKENSLGYYVDNDPVSLSKVIDEILSLPEQDYLKMRERTYEFCKKEFSIEKNVDKWVLFYKSLINL